MAAMTATLIKANEPNPSTQMIGVTRAAVVGGSRVASGRRDGGERVGDDLMA